MTEIIDYRNRNASFDKKEEKSLKNNNSGTYAKKNSMKSVMNIKIIARTTIIVIAQRHIGEELLIVSLI